MLKTVKIIALLIVILISLNVTVFASEIDMNLPVDNSGDSTADINSVTTDSSNSSTTDESSANIISLPATTSGDIGGSAAPSSVSSIAQENMSFSNILNILVITVGVIIILLGIAILIRLK